MTSSQQNNKRSYGAGTTKGRTFYGLRNQGSTCYLNSVLQVLFMSEEFREAVERHAEEHDDDAHIDRQLSEMFHKLRHGIAETVGVTNKLGIRSVNKQSDAAEYFEKILMLTSTEASQIFHGHLEHVTKCLHCNDKTYENGPFWNLPLTLPFTTVNSSSYSQDFSVSHAIEEFFQTSELNGENQLYCDRCHGKRDSIIECKMKHHPDILTLLLKRFEFNYNYMSYTKNECAVDVPHTLHMPQGSTYELYAFVEHFGSLKSGHYTATIKSQDTSGGRWYNFNDSRVAQLNQNTFKLDNGKSPYLLFYRKKKYEPNTRELTSSSTKEKKKLHRDAVKTYGGENPSGEDNTAVVINSNEEPPAKQKTVIRKTANEAPRSDEPSSRQGARKLGSQPKWDSVGKRGGDVPVKPSWLKKQKQSKKEKKQRKMMLQADLNKSSRLAGLRLRIPVMKQPNHKLSHFDNESSKDDPDTRAPSTSSSASERNNQHHDALKRDGGENPPGEDKTVEVVSFNRHKEPPAKQRDSDKSSSMRLRDCRSTAVQDDGGSARRSGSSHQATEGRDEKKSGNVHSAHAQEDRRKNTSDKEDEMRGPENVDKQAKKRKNPEAEISFQKNLKYHQTVKADVIRESRSDREIGHQGSGELSAKSNQKRETTNVGGVKEVDKMTGKVESGPVAPRSDEPSRKQDSRIVDSQPKANTAGGSVVPSDDVIISASVTRGDTENQSDDPSSKSKVKNKVKPEKRKKTPVKQTKKQKKKNKPSGEEGLLNRNEKPPAKQRDNDKSTSTWSRHRWSSPLLKDRGSAKKTQNSMKNMRGEVDEMRGAETVDVDKKRKKPEAETSFENRVRDHKTQKQKNRISSIFSCFSKSKVKD